MRLVVDSNIVMAAIIRDSLTRRLLFHPALELFSPAYLLEELREHGEEITGKSGLSLAEFDAVTADIVSVVELVSPASFSQHLPDARGILEDPEDFAFSAAAIALNRESECGIWTNDSHFTKKRSEFAKVFGIKIWNTTELYRLLSSQAVFE